MKTLRAGLIALGLLELLVGAGAMGGGGALMARPDGSLLRMPLEMLQGTPFRSYLVPGLLLCFVVGGTNMLAGLLALRQHASAGAASIVAGAALMVWIVTQLALIGYQSALQWAYLLCGLLMLCSGAVVKRVSSKGR